MLQLLIYKNSRFKTLGFTMFNHFCNVIKVCCMPSFYMYLYFFMDIFQRNSTHGKWEKCAAEQNHPGQVSLGRWKNKCNAS